MREILFRGKRVDNGEWVMSGNIIRFNDEGSGALYYIPQLNERCICKHNEADNIEGFENAMFYKAIPETVGQYTGLTDKNGKKIFEGDIARGIFDFGLEINSVVVFKDGAFGLLSKQHGTEHFNAFTSICNVEYEIIGNIHDDPKLLEPPEAESEGH